MPRIAAAVGVLATVVFSVGYNIHQYPVVWEMVAGCGVAGKSDPPSTSPSLPPSETPDAPAEAARPVSSVTDAAPPRPIGLADGPSTRPGEADSADDDFAPGVSYRGGSTYGAADTGGPAYGAHGGDLSSTDELYDHDVDGLGQRPGGLLLTNGVAGLFQGGDGPVGRDVDCQSPAGTRREDRDGERPGQDHSCPALLLHTATSCEVENIASRIMSRSGPDVRS